jgi:hypothetical protein
MLYMRIFKGVGMNKQHKLRPYQVSITPAMVESLRSRSKALPGCPRPEVGSLSHAVFHACMLWLDDPDLADERPELYLKSME